MTHRLTLRLKAQGSRILRLVCASFLLIGCLSTVPTFFAAALDGFAVGAEGGELEQDDTDSATAGLVTVGVSDIAIEESADWITMPVRLSSPSALPISITAFTVVDTAVGGRDHYGRTERIQFSPGETSRPIRIQILDDTAEEALEQFKVRLANATNADITNGLATARITDDNHGGGNQPVTSVRDQQFDESAGVVSIPVRLSAPATSEVGVTIFTRAGDARGGSDYYGRTRRLRFQPGDVEQRFELQLLDDDVVENEEHLSPRLVNATNASLVDREATIRINDDDQADGRSIFTNLEAEQHDAMMGVRVLEQVIGFVGNEDWVRFDRVDLGTNLTRFETRLAVPASNAGGRIEVRLDALNGPLLGTLTVAATGGWDEYVTQDIAINNANGVHDIYFRFLGNDGIANIDWFGFSPRAARGPSERVTPTLFGMRMHRIGFDGEWPSVPFPVFRIHDTGGLFWRQIQPTPDRYEFDAFDRTMAEAERNGVEVLYVLGQTPQWAGAQPDSESAYGVPGSSSEPRDMAEWREYVRAVATRYRGRIKYYEVWNEVNERVFYAGTMEALVEMARVAAATIESIDSNAVVIAPSFFASGQGIAKLDQYLALGGGDYTDFINVHYYMPPLAPPENIPTIHQRVKRVMEAHG